MKRILFFILLLTNVYNSLGQSGFRNIYFDQDKFFIDSVLFYNEPEGVGGGGRTNGPLISLPNGHFLYAFHAVKKVVLMELNEEMALEKSNVLAFSNIKGSSSVPIIIPASDGGYLYAVSVINFGANDAYIGKIDSELQWEWDTLIGTSTNIHDVVNDVYELPNGDFVIGGWTDKEAWIFKLSKNGQLISETKTYASANFSGNQLDEVINFSPMSGDTSRLVALMRFGSDIDILGTTYSGFSSLLVELDTDSLGIKNVIYSTEDFGYQDALTTTLHLLDDGSYALLRASSFSDYELDNVSIHRFSSSGQFLWEKEYGGNHQDNAADMVSSKNGMIFIAETRSTDGQVPGVHGSLEYEDIWVVEVDFDGNIITSLSIGSDDGERFKGLAISNDRSEIYLMGSGYTFLTNKNYVTAGDYNYLNGSGSGDFGLFKLSYCQHSTEFSHVETTGGIQFSDESSEPSKSWIWNFDWDRKYAAEESPLVPFDTARTYDVCLLSRNVKRCQDSICNPVTVFDPIPAKFSDNEVSPTFIYPNPTQGIVHIEGHESSPWLFKDTNGKTVISGQKFPVDISSLPSGLYFFSIAGAYFQVVKE